MPTLQPEPCAAAATPRRTGNRVPGAALLRILLPGLAVILAAAPAPAPAAEPSQALRVQLESAYNRWREATVRGDVGAWVEATSPYRHALTRNLIVSQKLEWPHALFEIPVTPPEILRLRLLAARSLGDTALLAYIGPVDFGVVDGDLPENVLVIQFHRTEGRWRFDRTQFVNLNAHPEMRAEIAKGDLRFLDEPQYALTGTIPKTVPPCRKPDYIGHVRIESIGYRTTVIVNRIHESTITNTLSTDVVIGGLRPQANPIEIRVEPVPIDETTVRKLEIGVFATHDLKTRPPARVFAYQPDGDIPPVIKTEVWVTPVTLRGQ